MDTQLRKRSVIIAGHRTSVSLEQPFWEALRSIARRRGLSVNAVIAEVDALRGHRGPSGGSNLSSALRVYILSQYMGTDPSAAGPESKLSA